MHLSFEGRPTGIELAADKMCVLYDSRDGRIVHYHRVVTLRGGRENTGEEIEKLAFETARLKHDAATLRVLRPLHLPTAAFGNMKEKAFRVNPRSLTLEEMPVLTREDFTNEAPLRQNSGRSVLLGALAGSAIGYLLGRKNS